MDGTLLEMFSHAVHTRSAGRVIGSVQWLRPILTVSVGDGEFLVAILESPGPFCYLTADDPLRGVSASTPFVRLRGAVLSGVRRLENQRVLRLVAKTADEVVRAGETLRLDLMLFGSAGRAELGRGDGAVLQSLGGSPAKGGVPPTQQPESVPVRSPGGDFYLVSRGRLARMTPREQDDPTANHRLGPFQDPIEACQAAGGRIVEEARANVVQTRARPIARRLANRRTLLAKLEGDLASAADHALVRREAETLAAYQSQIGHGARTVELPGVYEPGTTLSIELDPALPVRVQVEKRFQKAAKLERSESHIRRRMGEVSRDIDTLRRAITAVEMAVDFPAAMAELDDQLAGLPGLRRPGRTSGKSRGPKTVGSGPTFRRYRLDDVWFVLVGRSNQENDELTFHTASPTDWWFHAQHFAGSHVVLKSRGNPGAPPATILEKAAGIAAHFSKARHSSLAPVVYTQRKYVRKPRGARPGQVVCEREKMIMVEPRLPEVEA